MVALRDTKISRNGFMDRNIIYIYIFVRVTVRVCTRGFFRKITNPRSVRSVDLDTRALRSKIMDVPSNAGVM